MADFRKLFLVLAIVAALAIPASAQFTCTTQGASGAGSQTPIIRDGGLAELVGDLVLSCSGGAVGGTITANFQIFMNTTVTNKISTMTTQSGLLVNEGLGNPGVAGVSTVVQGILQSNLVTGDIPNTRNSILYPSVTLPTGTTSTIRIVNVRVVAPPASNTFFATQVTETVSTSPVGAVTIPVPTQVVGIVLPGLQFAVYACDGSSSLSALSFQQCISQPRHSGDVSFVARFTEGFPTSFKKQVYGAGDAGKTAGFGETVPGQAALTESGLTFGPISDVASQGTRLILRFKNIPAGVSFQVTNASIPSYSSGASAVLVNTSDATGTLPTGQVGPTQMSGSGSAKCDDAVIGAGTALTNVAVTSGTASATWEITSSTQGTVDYVAFGVVVKYTANTTAGLPGLTTTPAQVNGNFAPISTVDFADGSSPTPRFLDRPTGATVFSIAPCVTNILFPYVTNQGGFDTGIALVNTSLDNATGSSSTPANQPFNTDTQHGACTVYYFGSMAGGGALPAPQTTTDVAAGQMVTFAISQGGVAGATSSAAGFQGYVIARCNFQFAHGYAFVSDLGAQKLAHGYLALIIPDKGTTSRTPDPFTAAGAGAGEQLAP